MMFRPPLDLQANRSGAQPLLASIAPRLARLAGYLPFVILPLLAFPEIIFGGQTLYHSDISLIHYPYHIMVADEWLAGRVPLWNPYQHMGIPLLAEAQVSALYPLGALFLSRLSPALELSLFILVHFTLAGLFTFGLARQLGMGRAAATLAGLAYGMGGFLMAQVSNLNIMTGAAWLPAVLWAVLWAVERRRLGCALLAGIPLTLQILTAQPQVVFYTLIVVLGYALFRMVSDALGQGGSPMERVRHSLSSGLPVALIVVSGLLLAAPQLLPSLELQQLSIRSEERGLTFLTKHSLPPAMGLNLLLPSAFGNRVVGFKVGDPFEESFVYVGFVPLMLATLSWQARQRRHVTFFFLLLVGAALLAAGRYTPLYAHLIQYLPGFSLFRIPARWLMVVNLALAVLAGFGLQGVLERGLSRRAWLIWLIAWGALAAVLAGIWFLRSELLAAVSVMPDSEGRKLLLAFLSRAFSQDPIYGERWLLGRLAWLSAPIGLFSFNVLVAGVLFSLYAWRRLTPKVLAGLLLAAVSLDLVAAGGTTINPTQPDDWWERLSGGARYVMEHLNEGRVFPLGMGTEASAVSHLGQFFPSAYRILSAGGHGSPLMLARHSEFLHQAHPVQMVQVLGVRYILTLGQLGDDAESVYPLVYRDEDSYVYENRHPLPRAFVAARAILAQSPAEALAYFKQRELDTRHTVILETEEGQPPPPDVPGDASGTATITYQDPQALEIATDSQGDGYLVLLDTFYPGWVATLDGQSVPIYRADYVARAVYLPGGQHTLRFEYRPWSFRLGLYLALAVLVSIGASWLLARCGLRRAV